ncbi:hypothetical protein GALL_438900 [mine drainage metagenome]|uniref:Uncharacterized protein n=1 Tax=mine drainage metagenome TaxID=410659 RepID=A0A1J5QEP8_9ZZZZ
MSHRDQVTRSTVIRRTPAAATSSAVLRPMATHGRDAGSDDGPTPPHATTTPSPAREPTRLTRATATRMAPMPIVMSRAGGTGIARTATSRPATRPTAPTAAGARRCRWTGLDRTVHGRPRRSASAAPTSRAPPGPASVSPSSVEVGWAANHGQASWLASPTRGSSAAHAVQLITAARRTRAVSVTAMTRPESATISARGAPLVINPTPASAKDAQGATRAPLRGNGARVARA